MGKTKAAESESKPSADAFYAVARGRAVGIFKKWNDCQIQITGFKNPRYKKFATEKEAKKYLVENGAEIKMSSSSSAAAEIALTSDDNEDSSSTAEVQGSGKLSKFLVDSNGNVVVYMDGACRANGKSDSLAGIGVWFGDNHELNISERLKGRQTYNSAKIQAADKAISQAKNAGIEKLTLKTDSDFVVNCGTSWLAKWVKNGWKLGSRETVKNKEELESLASTMENIQLQWVYVTGKQQLHGSQQAKQLAVAGSKKSD